MMQAGDFHGQPTRIIRTQHLRLEFLAQAGPRIVRLSAADSDENLLAEIPNFTVPTPYGPYSFRGGHRLWHAPEAMPRTYERDDDGLTVEPLTDGVRLTQPTEPHTGLRKRIEIHLQADRPAVTLEHFLTNENQWAVEFAPWAITQLRLGGTGLLPLPAAPADAHNLLPNRRLALWPYSRWNDPRVQWGDDIIMFRGQPGLPPFKLGYLNTHGWMGYWQGGILFCKRFPAAQERAYPDYGSNAEAYCNDQFFELESLGPLGRVGPGETVSHTETWEVYAGLPPAPRREDMAAALRALGLMVG